VGAMAEQSDQIGKIFGKKMVFFLNTNVMINYFQNLALFYVKNDNFFRQKCKFFSPKIGKN
jgi:hypothetical protein